MGFFNTLMGKPSNNVNIADKIRAGAKVYDVRTKAEFADGHYPKAIHVPVDAIQTRLREFGAKEQSIIVYCASGARSAMAARLLKSAGYTDVVNAGGLSDMPRM